MCAFAPMSAFFVAPPAGTFIYIVKTSAAALSFTEERYEVAAYGMNSSCDLDYSGNRTSMCCTPWFFPCLVNVRYMKLGVGIFSRGKGLWNRGMNGPEILDSEEPMTVGEDRFE